MVDFTWNGGAATCRRLSYTMARGRTSGGRMCRRTPPRWWRRRRLGIVLADRVPPGTRAWPPRCSQRALGAYRELAARHGSAGSRNHGSRARVSGHAACSAVAAARRPES